VFQVLANDFTLNNIHLSVTHCFPYGVWLFTIASYVLSYPS